VIVAVQNITDHKAGLSQDAFTDPLTGWPFDIDSNTEVANHSAKGARWCFGVTHRLRWPWRTCRSSGTIQSGCLTAARYHVDRTWRWFPAWGAWLVRQGNLLPSVLARAMRTYQQHNGEKNMTKQELVDFVCTKQEGLSKKAANDLVEAIFEKVADTVRTEKKFTFPGFGTFELRTRKARMGVNPRNPTEKISIPETKNVGFTAAKALRDSLS
jgi:DNA-binding protein HU-beta